MKQSTHKIIYYWFPVILWMGVIYIMSSRQKVAMSGDFVLNFLFFKTLHILEYAFLYLLSYRAFRNSYTGKPMYLWEITAFLLVIFYAASDEIHQSFVPTREGKVRDVIIDTGGAVISWICIVILLPKTPQKLKRLARFWRII